MEDFLSFLIVAVIWIAVGVSARKAKKNVKKPVINAAKGAPRAAGKQRSAGTGGGSAPAAPAAAPAPGAHDHDTYYGSLGSSTSEGLDPCHDDPDRIPSGSLNYHDPEGTDPCHDDPYKIPSGSLRVELPEGTDPCHDDMAAHRPLAEPDAEAAAPGFPGSFTGNDIVRGFVWGEILNRKRA